MLSTLSTSEVLQALIAQSAAFVSVLLLASALHKAAARERAVGAVRELAPALGRSAPGFLVLAAGLELAAALALWLPAYRVAGAALGAMILGGYLALLLGALLQGRRHIDCGCTLLAARHPLGGYHIVRNGVLTGCCLAVAIGSSASGATTFSATELLAAVALLALYGALDQVMTLQAPRAGEVL